LFFVSAGLVNGTIGTVVDIVWKPGSTRSDLPLAVLVEIPTYTGPTLWRSEPREGFPEGAPIVPVAIYKQVFEFEGQPCSQLQLPLRLAWAVTVHKSQGLTIKKAQVGLGRKEFCSGLTFAALSRVTDIDGLMVVDKI
jgi:ATP-dependent exoDNAse (exonuclease V) alpha subunit